MAFFILLVSINTIILKTFIGPQGSGLMQCACRNKPFWTHVLFTQKCLEFCLASYPIPFQIEGMFDRRYCFCPYVGSVFQIEGMFNRR